MKVKIIAERCQGHGMCKLAAPQLFELDDVLGNGYVLSEDVPEEMENSARLARSACPEEAIEIRGE